MLTCVFFFFALFFLVYFFCIVLLTLYVMNTFMFIFSKEISRKIRFRNNSPIIGTFPRENGKKHGTARKLPHQ